MPESQEELFDWIKKWFATRDLIKHEKDEGDEISH